MQLWRPEKTNFKVAAIHPPEFGHGAGDARGYRDTTGGLRDFG